MNHEKLLQQVQEQHSALVKQLEAGYEEKLADLSKAAGNAEQNLQIERQECKEIKQQLEREQARANAVNELMRHSEELQSQVDKLQHALQEERRRANKIAQSSETALAAEKHLAEVAAQEYRIKQQVMRSLNSLHHCQYAYYNCSCITAVLLQITPVSFLI